VRMMTGTERDAWSAAMMGADGKPDHRHYRARLVAACVVGDSGLPLFSQADVEALANKSAAALDRVFAVCDRLNMPGNSAVDAAEKNSDAGQTVASS
jgi:hypothetical protein